MGGRVVSSGGVVNIGGVWGDWTLTIVVVVIVASGGGDERRPIVHHLSLLHSSMPVLHVHHHRCLSVVERIAIHVHQQGGKLPFCPWIRLVWFGWSRWW